MSSNATAATARRITATAKAAALGVRFVTSSEGSYSFRVVLHDTLLSGLDDITAGRAASDAIRALDGMTTTWGRARTGKIVINVTDETAREAAIKQQADARDEAMARELGYSSVEAYRGAPGRGPSPEAVATAVAQFQKELTAAAPAIGRIMDEPLPGEAALEELTATTTPDSPDVLDASGAVIGRTELNGLGWDAFDAYGHRRVTAAATRQEAAEELAAWRLSATERQRAEGERNARLMAHRTAMRQADRAEETHAAWTALSRTEQQQVRAEVAAEVLPPLTPAMVTLTNPELWA